MVDDAGWRVNAARAFTMHPPAMRCGRLTLVAAAIACAALALGRLLPPVRDNQIAACAKEKRAASIALRRICFSYRK